ncbi:thiamine phosphate synthase [Periweissella cryptocerci]|uniref:Thiamine-phosphate synthase n=1 Tax=Periweissella cryptocerci TaxID=2506420 RepID=A0A4P6YX78_9LACO|nr:thiamine phosphate synthase [Periweissella cryptocerci]QBO37417.1 thiamine phosphate synthase [Periweissella cryptocerci]
MIEFEPQMLQVYLVAGSSNMSLGEDLITYVERALKAGITMFQYREKGPIKRTRGEKLALAQQLRSLTRQYHVPLVIDDDLELAIAIGADGIHVGQSDTQIQQVVRRAKQQGMFVGLSVSTPAQLANSGDLTGVNYLGSGPVNATKTKLDADPAIGIPGLLALQDQTDLPIVAIGGINVPIVAIGGINVPDVAKIAATGIAGVAMISALTQANEADLKLRVNQIKAAFA